MNPDPRIYPEITVERPASPNRLWATPGVGGLAKIIILIPIFFVVIFYAILAGVTVLINSFVVLATGKYWRPAYEWNLNLLKILCKIHFFFMGLTDKYPGFSAEIRDNFTLNMNYPENPNRFYAVPVLGLLVRIVLLIPYLFYSNVLGYANWIGVYVFSALSVFFSGRYPESTFELARDSRRVSFASQAYFSGLSDRYPSFRISMNHKDIKIALLMAGAILAFASSGFFDGGDDFQRLEYENPIGVQNSSNRKVSGLPFFLYGI